MDSVCPEPRSTAPEPPHGAASQPSEPTLGLYRTFPPHLCQLFFLSSLVLARLPFLFKMKLPIVSVLYGWGVGRS